MKNWEIILNEKVNQEVIQEFIKECRQYKVSAEECLRTMQDYNYNLNTYSDISKVKDIVKRVVTEKNFNFDEEAILNNLALKWEHKFNTYMSSEDWKEFRKDIRDNNIKDSYLVTSRMSDFGLV